MRILLISPLPPPIGGIATWTRNIMEYNTLNPSYYQIFHQNTSLGLREIIKDSICSRIKYGIIEYINIIKNLKKNIHLLKPDVIHLTSSASLGLIKDYFIIKQAKKTNIPVVVHWRFGRIPELAANKNWEWHLLIINIKNAACSIVIDMNSYKSLNSSGFENIFKVPNPIGLSTEGQIKTKLNHTGSKKSGSILFVGRLKKEKGIYELVEACSLLPEIKELILAGPGEITIIKKLKAMASIRGNGSWLRFSGKLDRVHIDRLMITSTLLALPSYTEGFPNVVLEAMAMGCAVVATNVGAIPEILAIATEAPCGACVPPRNVTTLRNVISQLYNDPQKAATMGKNGIERVLKNYTTGIVFDQYKSVWENAVQKVK